MQTHFFETGTMMNKSLLASLFAAASADLSGHYMGSVPFIIQVDSTFNGDETADLDINVKVASKRFTCPGQKIAESDAEVTFPTVDQDGDGLGDGIRSDGRI